MTDRHIPIALVLLAILTSSCTVATPATPTTPTPVVALTTMGQHIGAHRIRASGATTAWDALRSLAPHHVRSLSSMPTRRAETTVGSGRSGLQAPRILLDGSPVVDPALLRAIPAGDLVSIDLLGALDAVMLFGQGYGGGAIAIRTHRR